MELLFGAPVMAATGWGAASAGATAAAASVAPSVAAGAGILGTLGTIASVASPAVSGAGMLMTSAGQKAQAEANAELMDYNRSIAEQEARATEEAGKIEEMKLDKQKKLMLSAEKAGFSASGFTLSGTPLAIMADTASQYEMDRSMLRANTATDAARRRSQGALYGMQATNQRTIASNTTTRGLLTGASSALEAYNRSQYGYRRSYL